MKYYYFIYIIMEIFHILWISIYFIFSLKRPASIYCNFNFISFFFSLFLASNFFESEHFLNKKNNAILNQIKKFISNSCAMPKEKWTLNEQKMLRLLIEHISMKIRPEDNRLKCRDFRYNFRFRNYVPWN